MPPMVTTESESVELDEWVIGRRSIEFNLKYQVLRPTRVPSVQTETTKRMGYTNATEVRSSYFDLAEGNTVDEVRTVVSRASEKGIRMKMPIARTTGASVIGSRGVVGGGTGSIPVLIQDGVGDFPSLFTLREYNGLDLEWWTNSSQITSSMLSLFPDEISTPL
jgi:hypothetical protein